MRWHIIITIACALHFTQALALSVNPSVVGVTSIFTIGRTLGAPLTITVFVAAAGLALWSQLLHYGQTKALMLIPQQMLLFISAAGALGYMYVSHFADGVVRPQAFIVADQSVTILLALGHAWALIEILRGNGYARQR